MSLQALKNKLKIAARMAKSSLTKRDGLARGAQLTSVDEEYRENPTAKVREVISKCPVHYDGILRDFLVGDGASAQEVLTNREFLSDARVSHPKSARRLRNESMVEEPPQLFADDPLHRRLRALMSRALTGDRIAALEMVSVNAINTLLEAVKDQEQFDFVEAIARPLPTMVVAELIGVEPQRHKDFKAWSDAMIEFKLNPMCSKEQIFQGENAEKSIRDFIGGEIQRRIDTGDRPDDLMSAMIDARVGEEKFSAEEMFKQTQLLLIAGNQTTTDFLGMMMLNLLTINNSYKRLVHNRSLIVNAIEESIRFDPPIDSTERIVHESINYKGTDIEKGYSIGVMLNAANRDPEFNENPDEFDIERKKIKHWSFGGGRHFCMGAPIARLEAKVLLQIFTERFPDLSCLDSERDKSSVVGFNGLDSLWLKKH